MAPTGTEVGNGDAIDVRKPAQFGVELYLCAGVHDVEFAAREIVHDGSVAELVDDLHRVDFPPGRLDPVRLRLEAELPGLFVDRQFIFGKLQQRSEEHTSELQSLMRISYAVFCLKK